MMFMWDRGHKMPIGHKKSNRVAVAVLWVIPLVIVGIYAYSKTVHTFEYVQIHNTAIRLPYSWFGGPPIVSHASPQYIHDMVYAHSLIRQGLWAWSGGRHEEAAHYFRAELQAPWYETKNQMDEKARAYLRQLDEIKVEESKLKHSKPPVKNAAIGKRT